MYNTFFQLKSNPFSQAQPLSSVFLPTSHRPALELLRNEINTSSGIFILRGAIGVGKSCLIKALVESFSDKKNEVVFNHLNPASRLQLSAPEHNQLIIKSFSDICLLNTKKQRATVFILDNANKFNPRFLKNLLNKVTENNKIQSTILILTGPLDLKLQIKNLELNKQTLQLIKSLSLNPFNKEEITDYINYRLSCSGYSKNSLFTDEAIQSIAELSKGIPWLINTICGACLFQASLDEQAVIESKTVKTATEFCFLPENVLDHQHTHKTATSPQENNSSKKKLTSLISQQQITTAPKVKIKPFKTTNNFTWLLTNHRLKQL